MTYNGVKYRQVHGIPLDAPKHSFKDNLRHANPLRFDLQRAVELRNQGLSYAEIATALGNVVTRQAIHLALQRYGIGGPQ